MPEPTGLLPQIKGALKKGIPLKSVAAAFQVSVALVEQVRRLMVANKEIPPNGD